MSGAVTVGVAAVAIGTAVATDFATFAVIAAVGATVGAIGSIAKVPALQIAGAAIGAVGAVGGLASAAGVFGAGGVFGSGGSVAGAFGGGAGAAEGVTAAAPTAFTQGSLASATESLNSSVGFTGGLAPEATWGGTGGGLIDQVSQGGMPTAQAASSPQAANPPAVGATDGAEPGATVSGQPGEKLAQTQTTNDILKGGVGIPATPQAGQQPLVDAGRVTGTTGPTPDYINGGQGANNPAISIDKSESTWAGIKDFLKENKTLVSGAIQGGASFLSGALSPLPEAQVNALNAQAKANRAVAERSAAEASILEMRASNMGQPIPVASRVTGRPALGLVNQAAPITGVPA